MKLPRRLTALFVALILHGTPGTACGPWFPRRYLEDGGRELMQTPEFFAEYELKLLAREYPVPFKAVRDEFPEKATRDRDLSDYEAALKDGSIRPPDVDAARAAHRRMREILRQGAGLNAAETAALPDDILDDAKRAVFPSEFADYHEGILEYGRMHHAAARAVWERLLARPAAERRYRSVNAAFMIGVLAVVDDLDDAPKWLAMARDLAQRGFHDSGGLAAATYSWESGWHEGCGDLRKAAEAALRSISAGYPAQDCISPRGNSPEELAKFATDPLLRRIATIRLLADHTSAFSEPDPKKEAYEPWLAALEAAHIRDFAGAERVAWMCYDKADYAGAKRWLARAPSQSVESLWLAGKLAARDGHRAEAFATLSRAARLVASRKDPAIEVTITCPDAEPTWQVVAGDFALAAMNAAEFRTAFDAFMRGDHWEDAAFVAERLLPLVELRAVIARLPDQDPKELGDGEHSQLSEPVVRMPVDWHWLLARRLARCGRFTEARPHFPQEYRAAFDAYTGGLSRGRNAALKREDRAMAFWAAALEARYHGMELFGTQAGPDWFGYEGNYEFADPAELRVSTSPVKYDDYGRALLPPPGMRAGKSERVRLAASAPTPDTRFHYRYHAADIAWRAVHLLPDNDQRLAEMLDLAGRWVAPNDPQSADKFYQELESRCAKTEIGKRATKQRWFVDIESYTIPRNPIQIAQKKE